ncbi:5-bromo-4-chloroindolyl phosphate hydrolysis family protein [Aneurinibacillus sp. BA2021]|nr:5-bromo-4-chloroindolyl phosphate hydrolysis family protein [Aneurinibacillus sp. BA2021]
MRKLVTTVWRVFVSGMISFGSLFLFFLLLGKEFAPAFFASIAVFAVSMWITGRRYAAEATPSAYSFDVELDKQDRAYIRQNIKEARRKLKSIRRLQFRIRSISIWQKTSHLYKVARRILAIIEEQPYRFRSARNFFSSYLDSTITIMEKYTFLISQPVRNTEMTMALKKTEAMLDDIIAALEEELMQVLSDDVLNLDVEIETMKKSLGTRTQHTITMPPAEDRIREEQHGEIKR